MLSARRVGGLPKIISKDDVLGFEVVIHLGVVVDQLRICFNGS